MTQRYHIPATGITASSTDTLTNKTLDADGTGNVITNIGASEIKADIVEGQTALAAGPAATDEILIIDGGALRRIDASELLNPENFSAVTLPAAADEVFINDDGVGKKITHDDLLFGASGTPSTQAHSDSAAKGTALDAARSDHKHAMPAAAGAVTREGGNTTEATTTSTSAADLLSATSMSIAVAVPFMVIISLRKTTGASSSTAHQLRLNTTDGTLVGMLGSSNAAEDFYAQGIVSPRVTNYLEGGSWIAQQGAAGSDPVDLALTTAAWPTATITAVTMKGRTNDASVTAGVDELHVHSLSVS